MVNYFRDTIAGFPDRRTGNNTRYSIEDAALGAFSVFFTQSPSFLSFQSAMQQTKGKNNAQSLFGINQIPCNNHIRDLLDEVCPSHVNPVFTYIFDGLANSGHLDSFRSYNDNLLIALDGTQYFSSNTIHCENCSQKHKNGTVTYSHSVVTPVVVAPGNNHVIALQPNLSPPRTATKNKIAKTRRQNVGSSNMHRFINSLDSPYWVMIFTVNNPLPFALRARA